jgi:hypothetical protein
MQGHSENKVYVQSTSSAYLAPYNQSVTAMKIIGPNATWLIHYSCRQDSFDDFAEKHLVGKCIFRLNSRQCYNFCERMKGRMTGVIMKVDTRVTV